MQHSIISILSSWPVLVAVTIATIVTAFAFWLRSDTFRFTVFAFKRPWAFGNDQRGQFQHLSRESSDTPADADGFVSADRALCKAFKAAISGSPNAEVTKTQFERAQKYLEITHQTTIGPPSALAHIGLFLLILAESVGTGYVLAPWMSTEITPEQANLAAAVLALAVAIILAILTHYTGGEMAKYAHYRKHSGTEGAGDRVGLGGDQNKDAYYLDDAAKVVRPNPPARRYFNRVEDPGKKGPLSFGIAAVIVVGIMVLLFVIRLGGVESETTKQIVSMETNGVADAGGSNPFEGAGSPTLPPNVAAAQQATRKVVAESLGGNYRMQGLAAASMLALIYFVTQFTAFLVAFRSGFAGQGAAAYAFTRSEQSFETFRRRYLEPRITRVETLLEQLRQARRKRNHRVGTGSFVQFLALGEKGEEVARDELINEAASYVGLGNRDEMVLRWELAMKNYRFSLEDQKKLRRRIDDIQLSSGGLPGDEPAPQLPAGRKDRVSDSDQRQRGDQIDESVVVAEKPDVTELALAYLQLKNDLDRTAFLDKQLNALPDEAFAELRGEIKRRKELAKSAEKYSDLLGD